MTFKINAVTDTETPTKNVMYFNYVFTVPEWVCYLATDSEGSLIDRKSTRLNSSH